MELLNLIFILISASMVVMMGFILWRLGRGVLRPLAALGRDTDSLMTRVMPVMAFLGLLAILLKLSFY